MYFFIFFSLLLTGVVVGNHGVCVGTQVGRIQGGCHGNCSDERWKNEKIEKIKE